MKIINKLIKGICICGFALARKLPPSYYRNFTWSKNLRGFFARRLIDCGKNVNIESGARFPYTKIFKLGDYSGIGVRAQIYGVVNIGKYVMMSPDVIILTGSHETSDINTPMYFQGLSEDKPVIIEDDVWIGHSVIILPGVTIGKGSIIGAGAVVSKNVPPHSVVVGNPAAVVKSRIEENNK